MKLPTYSENKLIAGTNRIVGNAINDALNKSGYGNLKKERLLLIPYRYAFEFFNFMQVNNFFKIYSLSIFLIPGSKVAGIFANKTFLRDFILDISRINTIFWKAKIDLGIVLGVNIRNFEENYNSGKLRL